MLRDKSRGLSSGQLPQRWGLVRDEKLNEDDE